MIVSEQMDLRSVDRSKLHSLEQVKIDTSLPCEQRIRNYVEQIGNQKQYLCKNKQRRISSFCKQYSLWIYQKSRGEYL